MVALFLGYMPHTQPSPVRNLCVDSERSGLQILLSKVSNLFVQSEVALPLCLSTCSIGSCNKCLQAFPVQRSKCGQFESWFGSRIAFICEAPVLLHLKLITLVRSLPPPISPFPPLPSPIPTFTYVHVINVPRPSLSIFAYYRLTTDGGKTPRQS